MADRGTNTERGYTALTWRGHTADYTDTERDTMRNLATMFPEEALVLHELKALLGASIIDPPAPAQQVYVYRWGNNPRRAELKGRRCVIEVDGHRLNTVLVRFLDTGERVTTSRRALGEVRAQGADYEPGDILPTPRPEPPEPNQLQLGEAA